MISISFDQLIASAIKILAIAVVLWLAFIAIRVSLGRIMRRVVSKNGQRISEDDTKRAATIARVVNRTTSVALVALVLMMALSEFGLNIGPLIAGAGIVGLAVGFGAQTLVKDSLSGLFILAENQYRVGDLVRISAVYGEVEDITLRRTVIRDAEGTVHHVPNGEIRQSSNFSRDALRVFVELPIAHGTEVERIASVVKRVGEELAADPAFKKLIKKVPAFIRVQTISAGGYVAVVSANVAPHEQWRVSDGLRARLLEAIRTEGIAFG